MKANRKQAGSKKVETPAPLGTRSNRNSSSQTRTKPTQRSLKEPKETEVDLTTEQKQSAEVRVNCETTSASHTGQKTESKQSKVDKVDKDIEGTGLIESTIEQVKEIEIKKATEADIKSAEPKESKPSEMGSVKSCTAEEIEAKEQEVIDELLRQEHYKSQIDKHLNKEKWDGTTPENPVAKAYRLEPPEHENVVEKLKEILVTDSALYGDGVTEGYVNGTGNTRVAVQGKKKGSKKYEEEMILWKAETMYETRSEDKALAVIGSVKQLGNWEPRHAQFAFETPFRSNRWIACVPFFLDTKFEWKWVVVDRKSREIIRWEGGENRRSIVESTRIEKQQWQD